MNKAITLLTCVALALSVWACGQGKKTDGSASGTAGTTKEREIAGDSGVGTKTGTVSGSANTPRALFDLGKEAMIAKDFEAQYNMMSKESIAMMGEMKKKMVDSFNKTLQQVPENVRPKVETNIVASLKKSLGVSSLSELESMSTKDYMMTMFKKSIERPTYMEEATKQQFIKSDIASDGKSATMTVRDHNGKEKTTDLVFEGGEWRLDLAKKMKSSQVPAPGS